MKKTFIVCLVFLLASCKSTQELNSSLRSGEFSEDGITELDQVSLVSENPQVEAATTGGLIAAIKKLIDKKRDAHPKSHGCFEGAKLTVDNNIPKNLQNALFVPSTSYDTVIRLSHGSGNPQANDLIPDIHGFAVKILLDGSFATEPPIEATLPLVNPENGQVVGSVPVKELQLSSSQGAGKKYYHSVDIITINALHEFMVDGLSDYRDFFAVAGILKEVIPHVLQNQGEIPTTLSNPALAPALAAITPLIEGGENYANFKAGNLPQQKIPDLVVEIKDTVYAVVFNAKRGGQTGTVGQLVNLANHNRTWDPLKSAYQSFVPYRYGGNAEASTGPAVKYQFEAIDCETKQPTSIDNKTPPSYVLAQVGGQNATNYLGAVAKAEVALKDHCFALKVSSWKNGFPSLDSAVGQWGDREYTRVAELKIPQNMPFMDAGKCEKLSFNPGHGPAEFQGAGEMQRARKLIYAAIETLRNQQAMGQ